MKPILLGMSLWGERHINTFKKYCWPSLLVKGNLPALKEWRDVGLIIHTDKESLPLLKDLPAPIIDVTTEDKYLQLGRHQNMDLKIAKEHGADYHLLMPDFVYSENCFSGMIKAVERGHKAIARLVISTVEETISPYLKPAISAQELATLSLLHIHPGVRNWLSIKDIYPATHVIAWEGKDTLRMCSPHVSPVYIANEVMYPSSSNLTLDAILDEVIIGEIYFPKPDDEIVMIEVSPYSSRKPNGDYVDLKQFINGIRIDTKNSARQFYIFSQETIDPINRTMLGDIYWNEIDINAQKRIVMETLAGG